MLCFKKENGFPCTLIFESMDYKDPVTGSEGYQTVVTDENGKVIKEFNHRELRARVHWADGYFTALRNDYMKFAESERLLKTIDKKKAALSEMKEHNRSAWDIYGSELCAGSMLAEEEKLQVEINQDMEKFLDTLPEWLREYSGSQI